MFLPALFGPRFGVVGCWGLAVVASATTSRGDIATEATAFLGRHCLQCHGATTPNAGLNLSALAYEPKEARNFSLWVRIYNLVALGEQFPAAHGSLVLPDAQAFGEKLAVALVASEQAIAPREKRPLHRRLGRAEFENASRDLFLWPTLEIRDKLPKDDERDGFNKSAVGRDTSWLDMMKYMDATMGACREIMAAQLEFARTRRDASVEPDGPPGPMLPAYGVLFGELPLKVVEATQPNAVKLGPAAVEVVSLQPRADAERLLRAFLARAYRRPVLEGEVQRYLEMMDRQLALGDGFAETMIGGYSAALAAPQFAFVEEKPGRLGDYALATRLAFFLWNSSPDGPLRALAGAGKLHDAAVLRGETERLLDDPRSTRFVEAFTDTWLGPRKPGSSKSDNTPRAFGAGDYPAQEIRRLVLDMLRRNSPIRELVERNDATAANSTRPLLGVSGGAERLLGHPVTAASTPEATQLLVANQDQLARVFLLNLVIFATGAPVRFADRELLEKVIADKRATGHGLRDLVHGLVQSDLFRVK